MMHWSTCFSAAVLAIAIDSGKSRASAAGRLGLLPQLGPWFATNATFFPNSQQLGEHKDPFRPRMC